MRPLFLLLLAFWSLAATAQGNGSVKGRLTDEADRPLEGVTLTLHRLPDSSTAARGLSAADGAFSIAAPSFGRYFVKATRVGMKAGLSEAFELKEGNSSIALKKMQLAPEAKMASGVTVTAKKPLIEHKIDRTVLNVEAAATNNGATALEVLEKAPGVTVDRDGNISLKGKEGVMVLIDGRPTQLSGADLANLLRSTQASSLETVEIMTNPPARFDASGNAGVINIRTKKLKQSGYNGSVNLGYTQGHYSNYNEGLNMNYRQGKLNFFTNLSHNDRGNFGSLNIQRNFRDGQSKELMATFNQFGEMINRNSSFNGKIGVDYSASKRTTLSMAVNGFSNRGSFTNLNSSFLAPGGNAVTAETRAISTSKDSWKHLGANFSVRRVLDSAGREITFDVDRLGYNSPQNTLLVNSYFNGHGQSIAPTDSLAGNLPQQISIFTVKTDYVHPLRGKAKLEAGLKTSLVNTDNDAIYDSIINGARVPDRARSNHFVYREAIHAGYLNLSTPLSAKWNAQFGLRLESTVAEGDQRTTGVTFRRPYTQLFPTAYLQYAASKDNNFSLNYGRRIRRPNYEDLNPFIEFLDRYTFQMGNPNLQPQFSHNIEVGHSFKGRLNTTLNYTKVNDIIQMVMEQNEATNETYVRKANIASQRQYGIAVSFNKPINKWWTTSLYVNGFNNRFEGIVDSTFIALSTTQLTLNGSQQFKLGKNTSAEVSGFFRTKALEGVVMVRPMGILNIGFSQQVMKGKGTLRLGVRDVLFTQVFSVVSQYGSVDAAFQQRRDSRQLNLGFSYRFSKGKAGGPSRRRGPSDEESRVGGGSN